MAIFIILILVFTIAAIAFLYIQNKQHRRANPELYVDKPVSDPRNVACCGAHEVCEAETLLTLSDEIIYYDDEELDAYRGIAPDDYSSEQIEEFRDILLSLQPHEVAGWIKSLHLREVELPAAVRDEALMITEDFRLARAANRQKKNEVG
ncbi:MAG: phospholipase [Bacteroidales bacterium]|jgi:hypothetical protein|nr:phospholipase [Bacteroidales bacterium]